MKDRNARIENRKWIQGEIPTTLEESLGVRAEAGVPAESVTGGVAVDNRPSATRGVPSPMPGPADDPNWDPTPKCAAITKAGNPCKAHPVKGTPTCIGHSR